MEPQKKLYSLEMFDDDDPEFVHSIVEMFVANTPVEIATIKEAIATDEMEKLRHHAHKLKPHFLFFGSSDIHQTMQKIEDIARASAGKEQLPGLIEFAEKNSALMIAQMKADLFS